MTLCLVSYPGRGLGYVDVHAHIIHDKFNGKEDAIALDCIAHQMDHVIVNGLEPVSNRQVLAFAARYSPYMLPAVGIYPLDAACQVIYTAEQVEKMKADGMAAADLPEVVAMSCIRVVIAVSGWGRRPGLDSQARFLGEIPVKSGLELLQ